MVILCVRTKAGLAFPFVVDSPNAFSLSKTKNSVFIDVIAFQLKLIYQ